MLRPDRAWPQMPPFGAIPGFAERERAGADAGVRRGGAHDTSYVCVMDKDGNVFSATPSDPSYDTPVIPGTGLCPSSRGSQSWADPAHASSVAPGKRPRLTPSPALAILPDGSPMPHRHARRRRSGAGDIAGVPQHDGLRHESAAGGRSAALRVLQFSRLVRAAQLFARRAACRRPRAAIRSRGLAARGHKVEDWPGFVWRAGAVCVLRKDRGVISAGADPRRPCYALGWWLPRGSARRGNGNARQAFRYQSPGPVAQHHDQQGRDQSSRSAAPCTALTPGISGMTKRVDSSRNTTAKAPAMAPRLLPRPPASSASLM